MKKKDALRSLLISGAVLLFSSLMIFSAIKVRYPVQGALKSEFNIIAYSSADTIKRGEDGDFILTQAQPGPCHT